MVHLVLKFKGDPPEDEREEDEHQGAVQGGEHHRIDRGKGGEGHPAGRDEPDLVAVPDGAERVAHYRFVRLR